MNYAEMGISERYKRGQDELGFKRKSIDKCGKLLVVGEKVISVISPDENYYKFASSALVKSVVKYVFVYSIAWILIP